MRNIVPRIPGVNTLGTPAKRWGAIYADQIVLPDNKTLMEVLSGQDTTIEEVLSQQNLTITNRLAAQDAEISNRLGEQDAEIDSRLNAQDTLISEQLAQKVDKTEADSTYLNLNGGTMYGAIALNDVETVIHHNDNTKRTVIRGGTNGYEAGASLYLCGKDNADSGEFYIACHNGSVQTTLNGYPNGSLTWGNKEIERVSAKGSNYIRFESGFQICWGGVTASTSGVNVNFPQAFNAAPMLWTSPNGYTVTTGAINITTKSASLTANTNAYVKYLAIGWWK